YFKVLKFFNMRFLLLLFTFTLFFVACGNQSDLSSDLSNSDLSNQGKVELLVSESGKNLTFVPLSKEEVEKILSNDEEYKVSLIGGDPAGGGDPGGGTSGLVIVCYDCNGPTETCFGIFGTDDCSVINCVEPECCCFEN
ncbi:MAG: hypothetical protein ACI8VT_003904, partial [Saprospiraceae bacterium]